MSNVNATMIAEHNDGLLAWLKGLATLRTDDDSAARYPALSAAFEALERLGVNLIAQTGFLPSGTNAGANKAQEQINKPFDVLPFPQAEGNIFAMANPREADQDTALTMAIIAALSVTTDETSSRDYLGNEVKGGGFQMKKTKDGDQLAKVKVNNKTFNAIVKDLGIKVEKAKDKATVYTLPTDMLAGLRSEVAEFPADAVRLPVAKTRPSPTLNVTINVKNGKGSKAVGIMTNDPEGLLLLLGRLGKGTSVGTVHVARETVVASWQERYADAGFRLITKDEHTAEVKAGKAAQAIEAQAESKVEETAQAA